MPILFPHQLRVLLRFKPRLPVFIHRPRVTVLPQVWQQFTLGIKAEGLLTRLAVAPIVEPLVLLLATGPGHPANRRPLLRSAHSY